MKIFAVQQLLFNPSDLLPRRGVSWYEAADCHPQALALHCRHYPRKNSKQRKHAGFAGAGEKTVLISGDADALFVWLKNTTPRMDGQEGVCCTIFRNEGKELSSVLILEAESLARARWGSVRFFTYVDPKPLSSCNPGYCFKKAGWRLQPGKTSRGLILLSKEPV